MWNTDIFKLFKVLKDLLADRTWISKMWNIFFLPDMSQFCTELLARLCSLATPFPSVIGQLCSQCEEWLLTCSEPTLIPKRSFLPQPGGALQHTLTGLDRGQTINITYENIYFSFDNFLFLMMRKFFPSEFWSEKVLWWSGNLSRGCSCPLSTWIGSAPLEPEQE